jgi:hypothetical protein
MTKSEFSSQGKVRKTGHAPVKLPVAYELELHRAIEMEAYLCAEKDGFRCSPLDYWLAAEANLHRFF